MNGIMATSAAVIDVRDMMCAQALAAVAQAVGRLEDGAALVILYNAADVKHDLLVWARDRHLLIDERDDTALRLSRDAHA